MRTLLLLAFLTAAAPAFAIELGIDQLESQNFEPLAGKRVGLITNQTGVDSHGVKTREVLHRAHNVKLVALFTPEHGLDGTEGAGRYVATRKDPLTGLTAYSLYGPTRKPTPEMLRGLDVLVFDLQDIGVRSYTYISTMARCMEAAGENNIEFMVLDRPNPLGGERVEGPPIEPGLISFVGQLPVPYVHGMTCGELAKMLNDRKWMAARCRLTVLPMHGWSRHMTWEDTGLRWVQTSPNIPHATSPAYYVATGIIGSLAGVEIGVGGASPFEFCAAPWISAEALATHVNSLHQDGITAEACSLNGCHGARLRIDPHGHGNICLVAVDLLEQVNERAHPDLFGRSSHDKLDIFYKVYGSHEIHQQVAAREPAPQIASRWSRFDAQFRSERSRYLLY